MDCRVVVEAAVPVYDVESADEAVRIAISKTGEMLNPDLSYVEIEMGERHCPHCGEGLEPAFVAADESLVALELEMKVFNVERDEHAARIARKEIGQRLENIPLEVLSVDVVEEDDEEGDDQSEAEEGGPSEDEGDEQVEGEEDDREDGKDEEGEQEDGEDGKDEEGEQEDGEDDQRDEGGVVPDVDEMLDDDE